MRTSYLLRKSPLLLTFHVNIRGNWADLTIIPFYCFRRSYVSGYRRDQRSGVFNGRNFADHLSRRGGSLAFRNGPPLSFRIRECFGCARSWNLKDEHGYPVRPLFRTMSSLIHERDIQNCPHCYKWRQGAGIQVFLCCFHLQTSVRYL